jgi:hypothetical protein
MVSKCEVSAVHRLVADLPFAGVPEGAISLESIFVSVRSTSLAGKDEDEGLASGGTDPALPLAAVDLMKVLLATILLADYEHAESIPIPLLPLFGWQLIANSSRRFLIRSRPSASGVPSSASHLHSLARPEYVPTVRWLARRLDLGVPVHPARH